VGFYTYRERLLGTRLVAGATTSCATLAGTSLVAPQIVAGRGDTAAFVAASAAGADTPARIQIAALGIDAPISPSAIDIAHGALGIPSDIHRAGWWRDGASPGDDRGAILVAGHVDSARAGAGAFFHLGSAQPGDIARLVTVAGHSFSYRVTTVRSYAKAALPVGIYARNGNSRLVLVTCGGPFDAASGHYLDNIVVTASPMR
jgi:hypothetical protein